MNNHWGLPLVLSRLNAQHKIAVLEMGMNHLEEIRYLMKIARPTVGLVTNAGSNHIGLLGSLENIAKAKGELFEELSPTGTAVLNRDDRFFSYWSGLLTTQEKYLFGFAKGDFYANNIGADTFELVTPIGRIDVRRVLLGQHNVMNAVAAVAAVFAAGILDLSMIKTGLENVTPEHGRLEPIVGQSGTILLDDTYNGGEASILSGLQVLSDYPAAGRKIAVIGDMSELGEFAISMHVDMGENIMRFSPDVFVAFGPLMKYAYQVYSGNKEHFLHHEDVVLYLRSFVRGRGCDFVQRFSRDGDGKNS
ncbi:MAG: UDP-N-acetylmuramoyl-tripeptide--D-alanyl-D-alanine ligase [Gammaproteobacteria bacterium]|nr:UDP-N-acetylmuramoyl-tripeptide--D-alanyl-D-alanine ligase [Gammaproteobacteria bacterium]